MQMLYNSDSFSVLLIDVEADAERTAVAGSPARAASEPRLRHGGYEIVDKFAQKEIFLQGALAERFKEGVEALIETQPSEEEIDDYLEQRFAPLMHQTLVLH